MRQYLILLVLIPSCLWAASQKPSGYAISSAHPLATKAGLEILAAGGNAFDAAIAVSSTLGVVAPYHSGLGGGGFWLLYDATKNKHLFLDGRERAPLAATADMYLSTKGKFIQDKSLNGALAAAIPGQAAAIAWLAKNQGVLPLAKSLAPAIKLAELGFVVDHQFQKMQLMGDRLENLQKRPSTAKVFLKDNKPYPVGAVLRQPELAQTLRELAEKGHDGFYRGRVANQLVDAVRRAGGIWTQSDLEQYKVILRAPLVGAYHNMLIITAPPPSAGGIALLTMLNILQGYDLGSFDMVKRVHVMVEAMRLAYWQRTQYLGDPEYVSIPLKHLLSIGNANTLRKMIPESKPIDSEILPQKAQTIDEGMHTTHFSIIDQDGNKVAATLTVNFIFGSSLVAEGTGVLLNDEMDDFSAKPGVKNIFGLIGSDANKIAPGKTPLSSMSPTFLEMPGRAAILGTPGGSRIPTMVLLAALKFFDGYGALTMVSAMRFHHQYLPDWLQLEPDSLPPKVIMALKTMGYKIMVLKDYYGDMQAISWDKKRNLLTAASDPRHIGLAMVRSKKVEDYGFTH